MSHIFATYIGIEILIVVAAFIGTFVYRFRRRRRLAEKMTRPPAGFEQTDEIFIDPTTGIRQQVWYNPQTGERFYRNAE